VTSSWLVLVRNREFFTSATSRSTCTWDASDKVHYVIISGGSKATLKLMTWSWTLPTVTQHQQPSFEISIQKIPTSSIAYPSAVCPLCGIPESPLKITGSR
jgi:hypothetical protein